MSASIAAVGVASAVLASAVFCACDDDVGREVLPVVGCSFSLVLGLGFLKVRRFLGDSVFIVKPASFCQKDFLKESHVGAGFRHAIGSFVLLGTLVFALVVARMLPDMAPMLDGRLIEDKFVSAFPADVRMQMANGTLEIRPAGRKLRVALPRKLLDMCGGPLLETARSFGSMGVMGLNPLGVLLGYLDDVHNAPVQDPYVQVNEFALGEVVEARLDHNLVTCGARLKFPKSWAPGPIGGHWIPAVVVAAKASSKLTDFSYTLRLIEGDVADWDMTDELDDLDPRLGLRCQVKATALRRQDRAVFLGQGAIDDDDLQGERAMLIFESERFAILQGYSYFYDQHWRYANAGDDEPQAYLWHDYDLEEIYSFNPLSCAVGLYCDQMPPWDLREQSGLVCSREIARSHLQDAWAKHPVMAALLRNNLHIVTIFALLWAVCVVSTVLFRILVLTFFYTPIAYIACSLLRHVDTPLVPISRVFGLALYSAVPLIYFHDIAGMMWEAWGVDSRLPTPVQSFLEWETNSHCSPVLLWAVWTGFLVIRMREHQAMQDHRHRVATLNTSGATARPLPPADGRCANAADATSRAAPPTVDGSATCLAADAAEPTAIRGADQADEDRGEGAVLPSLDGEGTCIAANLAKPTAAGQADGNEADQAVFARDAVVVKDGVTAEQAAECAVLAASTETADAKEMADVAGEAADEAAEVQPVCRICYGGREAGRLISPCLCAGTMGLVHLECLNMWRLASSNPHSFYQCDQCQYRYSFKRALYAKVLRSALVLHMLMIIAFASTVLGCSYMALIVDQQYGGIMQANVSSEFLEHLANETDLEIELLKEQLQLFHSVSWHGIHLVHFFSGLLMVGVSGFVSMGFYWFPLFGGPGHTGVAGPIMVIVVVITGTVRVMFGIYKGFKVSSGWLLRSAESMILEVGVGVDERYPLPPPEPEQPADAAGNAAADFVAKGAADAAGKAAADAAADNALDALASTGVASTDGDGSSSLGPLESRADSITELPRETTLATTIVEDYVETPAVAEIGAGVVGDATSERSPEVSQRDEAGESLAAAEVLQS